MRNNINAEARGDQHRRTVAQEARDMLAECDAYEAEMASECIARRNEWRAAKQ